MKQICYKSWEKRNQPQGVYKLRNIILKTYENQPQLAGTDIKRLSQNYVFWKSEPKLDLIKTLISKTQWEKPNKGKRVYTRKGT